MEHAAFLRKHLEEIITLSDEEFELVYSCFTPKRVNKKELLIKSGDKVVSEFLVAQGLLKAYMHDLSGKEHIIQFAMENWWISDYPAYKLQATGEMCVQALEPCLVLELTLENRAKLCEQLPKMIRFHEVKAFNGYVALQKRVLSLMKNSTKENYDLLLDQYPELFQRVSKTMIAHYLGVSRESLSRLHDK